MMTKFEMTFGFGGKKSRNELGMERRTQRNTEQPLLRRAAPPRAVYGTPN